MKRYARGEINSVPSWCNHYTYAEQFHCHPQDVPRVVTVRAWERWLLFEQVRTARQAWQHAQQVEDWTRDLSASERAAMRWALEETEIQDESNPNHTHG